MLLLNTSFVVTTQYNYACYQQVVINNQPA